MHMELYDNTLLPRNKAHNIKKKGREPGQTNQYDVILPSSHDLNHLPPAPVSRTKRGKFVLALG
jgi:hypothetical protein